MAALLLALGLRPVLAVVLALVVYAGLFRLVGWW
jgi:hypothetical protein